MDRDRLPNDPMLKVRQPDHPPERLQLPVETVATRRDLPFWLENMLVDHRFTWEEAARVCGWSVEEVQRRARELGIRGPAAGAIPIGGAVRDRSEGVKPRIEISLLGC